MRAWFFFLVLLLLVPLLDAQKSNKGKDKGKGKNKNKDRDETDENRNHQDDEDDEDHPEDMGDGQDRQKEKVLPLPRNTMLTEDDNVQHGQMHRMFSGDAGCRVSCKGSVTGMTNDDHRYPYYRYINVDITNCYDENTVFPPGMRRMDMDRMEEDRMDEDRMDEERRDDMDREDEETRNDREDDHSRNDRDDEEDRNDRDSRSDSDGYRSHYEFSHWNATVTKLHFYKVKDPNVHQIPKRLSMPTEVHNSHRHCAREGDCHSTTRSFGFAVFIPRFDMQVKWRVEWEVNARNPYVNMHEDNMGRWNYGNCEDVVDEYMEDTRYQDHAFSIDREDGYSFWSPVGQQDHDETSKFH